jgi:protein ImuA
MRILPPQLAAQLQSQVAQMEGLKTTTEQEVRSTGTPEFDALFPGGGLCAGSITEWLSPAPGAGVGTLALLAARGVLARGGMLVICDSQRLLYPPALAAVGIDLAQVIIVQAKDAADHCWAIDQALRSPAVALVYASLAELDDKTSRRFQLAAETSGAIGLLLRPATARGQPTWAEVQLAVTPLVSEAERQWSVECARARGPTARTRVVVAWNEIACSLRTVSSRHETPAVSLASRLARATSA